MNKYSIDFFYMHLFTMRCQCVLNWSSNQDAHYSCPRNTWLKLFVYEYQQFFQHRICFAIQPQLPLVNLHRNRRYFVIKLHTWFCQSYFLKTNITFYCIYQYFMSINSFFHTAYVSRYSRPITAFLDFVIVQTVWYVLVF